MALRKGIRQKYLSRSAWENHQTSCPGDLSQGCTRAHHLRFRMNVCTRKISEMGGQFEIVFGREEITMNGAVHRAIFEEQRTSVDFITRRYFGEGRARMISKSGQSTLVVKGPAQGQGRPLAGRAGPGGGAGMEEGILFGEKGGDTKPKNARHTRNLRGLWRQNGFSKKKSNEGPRFQDLSLEIYEKERRNRRLRGRKTGVRWKDARRLKHMRVRRC